VSTPGDIAAFFGALFSGRVIGPETLAQMTTCTEMVGEQAAHGLGLVRYDFGLGTWATGTW
jgi:hypothetical protein